MPCILGILKNLSTLGFDATTKTWRRSEFLSMSELSKFEAHRFFISFLPFFQAKEVPWLMTRIHIGITRRNFFKETVFGLNNFYNKDETFLYCGPYLLLLLDERFLGTTPGLKLVWEGVETKSGQVSMTNKGWGRLVVYASWAVEMSRYRMRIGDMILDVISLFTTHETNMHD